MTSDLGDNRRRPVQFEVCKHGWLKRLPPIEKKLSVKSPFSRIPKAEKLWVAFCIHDGNQPWLEFYENRRSAFSHRPLSRESLSRCLHVSPSIRFHEENEHVLSIMLENEDIKLALQTREQMMDWLDAMRLKLRSLGILTPRDNLYSEEPEASSLSMQRNPNSPLPPTPGSAFLFPPNSSYDFREEISTPGAQSSRHGISPAPSIISCPPGGGSNHSSLHSLITGGSFDHPHRDGTTSSVVSYVRPNSERQSKSRRSHSFRTSLPSSPAPITFVRSPQGPQVSPRDHVTVINVASNANTSFNFDNVSAVLESSSGVNPSELYDAVADPDQTNHNFFSNDPNALQMRVGNSLDSSGGTVQGIDSNQGGSRDGRQSLPSQQSRFRQSNQIFNFPDSSHSTPHGQSSSSSNYEPLCMAYSDHGAITPKVLPQAPNTGLLRRRSEHRRSISRREQARRAASVGPSIAARQPFPISPAGHVMSLREQQVLRLEKEISHTAGVRLTLRKVDCVNTIAFVNCFNQVYIAGWKQRLHPYLHNTFHIGDRIISIGGNQITSASDAHEVIKSEDSVLMEFVVRRVPYGKVFTLKRDKDGEPLGIVREGNTAEIRQVLGGSLASKEGLTSRAPTVDGRTYTTWVITEINHRPLNLFFKGNEVGHRLNQVGRDISILVQPYDLVKQMKKQLKTHKSYKDYIVM